jgi:hypothetical protein
VVQQPVVVVERGYDRRYDGRYATGRRYRDDRRYRGDHVYGEDPYYDFNREYWDRSYGPNQGGHVHTDSCGHDY